MRSDGRGIVQVPDDSPATERLSPETVRKLFDAHGREVLEFLTGVLRDANSAQDVLQITFRRVLEVGHTASEESFQGWIFKLALQEAQLFRRQRTRTQRQLQRYADNLDVEIPESFDDKLLRAEELAQVRQLLSQLPADQRHVITQRLIGEKTFAIIAEELGVPLGTVLTRMRLGLDKLRKWLGND